MISRILLSLATIAFFCSTSKAQSRFILNDRTNHVMWRGVDANNNGNINDAGELTLFFSSANASGTPAPSNPTCLDIGPNGFVVMGDQGIRTVFLLRDLNDDGDAQDSGESVVFADASNASGISFAFPTGVAFDSLGRIYITNAGNAFGNDGIYRLVDLNGNGTAQDAGEITEYVGAPFFGPGNGSFSPQEIFFDVEGSLFMHNSSSGLNGVWRFRDLNSNGRADDAGESNVFWDGTNAAGTPANAGFAMEPDRARAHSMYILQTASGSLDQLVRLTDLNNDGDAQDAGESAVVWSSAESGFTNIDCISMYNGDVLVTDSSGKRIILLHDSNGNGSFMDAGERTDYFTNPGVLMGDVRQISILPICGDVNRDGVRDLADVDAFVNVLTNVDLDPYHRLAADVNKDWATDARDTQHFCDLLTGP